MAGTPQKGSKCDDFRAENLVGRIEYAHCHENEPDEAHGPMRLPGIFVVHGAVTHRANHLQLS